MDRLSILFAGAGDDGLHISDIAAGLPGQWSVAHASGPDEVLGEIEHGRFDVLLLSAAQTNGNLAGMLTRLRAHGSDAPSVLVTGVPDHATGANLMRHGARDYLVRGQDDREAVLHALGSIAERRTLERALVVSEQRVTQVLDTVTRAKREWEGTFDAITNPIFLHDADYRIIRANTAYQQLTGLPFEEIIGRPYFTLFPKQDGPLQDDGAGSGREVRDQTERRIFRTRTFRFDETAACRYTVWIFEDITGMKLAEENLQELFLGTVKSLSRAIDAKSAWTAGHSDRVTRYAVLIGRLAGLSDEELRTVELAGLLHDVGKLGTFDAILDKKGVLTPEEYEIIKQHPLRGAELLTPIRQMNHIIPAVRHHHERYDGEGYPDGLKAGKIPYMARILAVADAFDSMTGWRPYRRTFNRGEAIEELRSCSGTQFDPELAESFIAAISRDDLPRVA